MNKREIRIIQILLFAILSLLIFSSLLYIEKSMCYLTHDNIAIDFGEGIRAFEIWEVSNFINPYYNYLKTNNIVPINPYPPFYHIISSLFVKLGLSPLTAGRLVSILSTILISFIVYKILNDIFYVNKLICLISSLMVFSIPYVFIYSTWARVDMLGILLTLTALYFFLKDRFYSASIFLMLALFTRQSYITLLIAVLIILLRKREFLKSIFLVGICLLPHIIALLFIPNYFENVVLCNLGQGVYLDKIYECITFLMHDYLIFLIMVALIITLKFDDTKYKLIKYYAIISWIFSIFSFGKPGSFINYFIEPLILSVMIYSIIIAYLQKKQNFIALFIIYLLTIGSLFNYTIFNEYCLPKDEKILKTNWSPLYNRINEIDGTIFFEDAYLSFKSKKGQVVDIFLLTALKKRNMWNNSLLIDNIKNRKYGAIITMYPLEYYDYTNIDSRYTKEFINATLENYAFNITIYKEGWHYYIYLPKNEGNVNNTNKMG